MSDSKQLPLFDLPPLTEAVVIDTFQSGPQLKVKAETRPTGKRSKQLALEVRFYNVRTAAGVYSVQAATPSAAKYAAFRQARMMGQYLYQGGFLAFVSGGCSVKEDRK